VLSLLTTSSGHRRLRRTSERLRRVQEFRSQCDPSLSGPTGQSFRMKVADWPVLGVPESAGLLCAGVVDLFAEFNLAGLYEIPLCVEAIVGSQMEHRVVHVSRAGCDIRATREREIQFA
jgi:hypothetical protein